VTPLNGQGLKKIFNYKPNFSQFYTKAGPEDREDAKKILKECNSYHLTPIIITSGL